jgi:hypothetical protein
MSGNSASKSQGRRRVLVQVSAAIISILAVIAVPISVNLVTQNVVEGSHWLSSYAWWIFATLVLLSITGSLFTFGLARYTQATPDRAFKLLQEFNALERTARDMLGETDSASPIRIRSSLATLGIWSKEDVVAFNAAVRVRNSLVHGDLKEFDRASVDEALTTIHRLREKLLKQARGRVT